MDFQESPESHYGYEIAQFASVLLILDHTFIYKVCSAEQYLQIELSHEYVEQSWFFMYWCNLTPFWPPEKQGSMGRKNWTPKFFVYWDPNELICAKKSLLAKKSSQITHHTPLEIFFTFFEVWLTKTLWPVNGKRWCYTSFIKQYWIDSWLISQSKSSRKHTIAN